MANTSTKAKTKASAEEEVKEETSAKEGPIVAKDIDPEQYVTVRNGFQGKLVYKSRHTGEKFVWDRYGAEQDMQLRELKNAKSSAKRFFSDNWFMFDENWVIDYLGVRQYYKHAIDVDHFDDIFSLPANELKATIGRLSAGQKKSVKYRALELIANGDIDSRKTIAALEDALGVELIEK
jgi:hypothetical protein